MNEEIYTHILDIKIISLNTNTVINHNNIEEIVKNEFLNKQPIINGIKLNWKKMSWKGVNKYFHLGNLIINNVSSSDSLLLENVEKTILNIDKKFHKNGLLPNNTKIIFIITKPLQQNIHNYKNINYMNNMNDLNVYEYTDF